MTIALDEAQIHAWLTCLYGDTEGHINICSPENWAGRNFRDIDKAVAYIKLIDRRQPKGVYARVTTLNRDIEKGRGGIEDTKEFTGFWGDLDITGPGHKFHVCDNTPCSRENERGHRVNHTPLIPGTEECLTVIEVTGLPAPTEWVHSGGGMYPWWLLPTPHQVTDADDLARIQVMSENWQEVIRLAAEKLGYHYGAGYGDLARVLRIPGTVNRKVEDAPTMCEWRTDLSISRPYELGELETALDISLRNLAKPKPVTVPATTFTPVASTSVPGNRPGDAFNAATTWRQLLEADGATMLHDRGGYIEWVRPGKDPRDGMSATTGYKGSDVLKVFSDAWLPLRQDETYDRFGYYAHTRHNGDLKAATKALAAMGYGDKLDRKPSPTTIPDEWNYTATNTIPAASSSPAARAGKPTYTFTDSGLADRMQARHGDEWRFVASRQRFGWLRWDGTTWVVDRRGAVTNLVDQLVQEEYDRIGREEEDPAKVGKMRDALKPMLSNSKQVGATSLFARRPQIAVDTDELDKHPSKITCDNGVIDLDTMTFGPHDRSLLATRKLNVFYDPDAKAPGWNKFLEQVLPDPAVREYLQRAIGYTLLGKPTAKAIFMLHGESNTGKSQIINAMMALFGGFAESAKEQTFRISDTSNGPTPGLHKLRGARLVTTSETTEGLRLDEALIKKLTGGDAIDSRPLYGDEETWLPEFSIWFATNHLPKLNSDDNAIWRRVKPIHFTVVFGSDGREDVHDIGRKLVAAEGPGILNWILEGAKRYQQSGLIEPQTLTEGVTAYRRESDPVARFISQSVEDECLVVEADGEIPTQQLYSAFVNWCQEEGIRYPLSMNRFGRRMTSLGFTPARSSALRKWKGLSPGRNTFIISGRQW